MQPLAFFTQMVCHGPSLVKARDLRQDQYKMIKSSNFKTSQTNYPKLCRSEAIGVLSFALEVI